MVLNTFSDQYSPFMKPHLIIKLHQPMPAPGIPHWLSFIDNKTREITAFGNTIDEIFQRHNRRVWITMEYKPAGDHGYTSEERSNGFDRIYRVIMQDDQDIAPSILRELEAHPLVEAARTAIVGKSDIPGISTGMGMNAAMERSRNSIYAKEASMYSKGHPDIKIAILDTGADITHPELAGSIRQKADFVNMQGLDTSAFIGDTLGYDDLPEDEVGHGTHVAGIIAAKGIKMPEGIVPKCSLMIVRVLATIKQDQQLVGAGLIDNINTGIKWAVDQGADVINMSLGVKHEHGGLPHEEVIRYALGKGVTIVAASGNDGTNDKYYPGALPGVMAVGAVNDNNEVAGFSTYGTHISLVAPGVNIYSSYKDKTYAISSGTSQASPFVSAAVALLKSVAREKGKTLTDQHIKNILKNSSDRTGKRMRESRSGYGRINLVDAVKLLQYSLS